MLWIGRLRRPYIRLHAEFVYLAVILDSFSRKVVGWALERTLSSELVKAALQQAIAERQPKPGLVHHSDRGLQYAAWDYVAILEKHQIIPSMSRPANPYDNAGCESFLKTLKQEEIYVREYGTLEQLQANVEEFIEQYYNRLRLHSALGYRPPEEFEQQVEASSQPARHQGRTCPSSLRFVHVSPSSANLRRINLRSPFCSIRFRARS